MKRGDVAYVVDGGSKFIAGIATDCVRSTRKGVSRAGQKVVALHTLAMCGAATSKKAKVLMGVSLGASAVALVASSPVVVKVALGVSVGSFFGGMVTGFREAMVQIKNDEASENN